MSVIRSLPLILFQIFQNWEKEFKKWLGNERLKVFSMSPGKRIGVHSYNHNNLYSALASYCMRIYTSVLCTPWIDLVLLDINAIDFPFHNYVML